MLAETAAVLFIIPVVLVFVSGTTGTGTSWPEAMIAFLLLLVKTVGRERTLNRLVPDHSTPGHCAAARADQARPRIVTSTHSPDDTGPEDWSEPKRPAQAAAEPNGSTTAGSEPVTGEFAGIPISEFVWARQHGRRMVLVWVALVLAITGLAAAAAWTVGSMLNGLL